MTHAVLVFDTFYVDESWAIDLESTIERVLGVLIAEVKDPPEDRPLTPSPSGEPFDGCDTCVRRETMVLTIMSTIDAVREGIAEQRLLVA
jgi:hypothetical protein